MWKRARRARSAAPRSRARRIAIWAAQAVGIFVAASLVATVLLRFIPPVTSAVMVERRIDALVHGRRYHVDYRWVPWTRISPRAALAVISAEDQNFATHWGFDVGSIEKAINAHEHGQRLRGASTISQQVAKNLFLWTGRSYVRKALEAYFTVLIELTWSKRRILEVYLNIVELGDGVFGVQAASERFFHKPASRLTTGEAALLAAVLPNPIRFRVNRPSAYVLERRDWIVQQMYQLGGTGYIKRF